ncbi:MAG: hypothetical protein LBE35_06380 [Clostridiales bacterium]|nr:hypothetical protein [Clostridiales bacterium]
MMDYFGEYRERFAPEAFEGIVLEAVGVYHRFFTEGVSDCAVDSIKGEGVAFDLLRLGVGCICGGYSPEIIGIVLDSEVLTALNAKGLSDKEILELNIVKTLIPLIQAGKMREFAYVVWTFSRTAATSEALNKKIYPFQKAPEDSEFWYVGDWVHVIE